MTLERWCWLTLVLVLLVFGLTAEYYRAAFERLARENGEQADAFSQQADAFNAQAQAALAIAEAAQHEAIRCLVDAQRGPIH